MIIRFGNVVGDVGSVVSLFKKQIQRGGPVTVTHPEVTCFFMTIPEACQLILPAGAMGESGKIDELAHLAGEQVGDKIKSKVS